MIQIIETKTGYAPIIVCDQCGLRIEDANLAVAIAPMSGKFQNGKRRVLHVHKESCFDKFEKTEKTKYYWEELSRHLRLIINNAGLTPQELIEQSKKDTESELTNK